MSTREDPEFNNITQRWEYEDEDGISYQQDPTTRNWMPIIDEELLKSQQAAYSVPGVDEHAPALDHRKKRKIQETFTSAEQEQMPDKHVKKDKPQQKPRETSVYVQGLPLDVTVEEMATVFSKCGLLSEDPATGQPRIKIYTDSNGRQKGDALVIYFRPESVDLALQLLDETSLRGDDQLLEVSKASFEHKKKSGEDQNKKPRPEAEKKKASRRAGKLNSKLADWSDDDVDKLPKANKYDKIVILKGMFSLDELEKDPSLLLDLKDDVREECEKLGEITNVTLYDKEEEGIMRVKFKDAAQAQNCIKLMNGRYFGGAQIVAELHDGRRRYMKTGKNDEDDEGEAEEQRLEKFGAWLEGDE